MGKVKSHLENIDELRNFVQQTLAVITIDGHQAVMSNEHCELFQDLLATVETVRSWVMLPDHHQAALRVLDGACRMDDKLHDVFDTLVRILARVRSISNLTPQHEVRSILVWTAQISLLAYAQFIVNGKEDNDGQG